MLTCKSRLRLATRSLIVLDRQTAYPDILLALATPIACPSTLRGCKRNHATIASISKGHHLRQLREALRSKNELPLNKSRRGGPGKVAIRDARAREINKHHLDIGKDDDASSLQWSSKVEKSLQTELKWTGGDALKLAQTVLDRLKGRDPERALELVRTSEKMIIAGVHKGVDSVVSWNHIMDYYMSQNSTRDAFRVFNEMKKRGHIPDAHTYTIMLRGFTLNHKKPRAVEDAMKVYDSMWRPESKIRPNIIHSNAIINCLGRALNMDALWSVAGRLPDRGPGAPDKWTYTTILNTMQACAVRDASQLMETDGDEEAAAKMIQKTVGEGRRLWEDIVSRWKSGDVNIDQTLVCAMGRLLLLGQRADWDDIFSLVEQTMRLPRVSPPLVHWGRGDGEALEKALALAPPKDQGGSTDLEQLELAVASEAGPKVKNEFAVVDLSDRPLREGSGENETWAYAIIGSNVLSLLIETAFKLKDIPTGKMYWEKLTNPDNEPFVAPDDDNLHAYLRLLRMSRSSKAVVDLLRQPVHGTFGANWHKRATFVLAMSTCARDFKNPNVFTHASTVLDLMQAKMKEPDLKVMTMFLSLAMVTTPGVSTEIKGDFNAKEGENNLIRAILRFHHSNLNYPLILDRFHNPVAEEDGDIKVYSSRKVWSKHANRADHKGLPMPSEELLEFLRTLNSACDKLMNHMQKLTDRMAALITDQKREISRELQRLNPDASPPSRAKFVNREPADALEDHDEVLAGKKYPDALGRKTAGNTEQSRLVDLGRGHRFLEDHRDSRQGERRSRRDQDSSAYSRKVDEKEKIRRDQQSSTWSRNHREERRSRRDQESSTRSRNPPEERRPSRDQESSSLAEGWSNAWKKSVKETEDPGQRKDWVVV